MTLRITELPKFSSQLRSSIQTQLNQYNSAKQLQKVKQNIKHIQEAQKDIQTSQLSNKLTYNIVFQFLRKHNLNYTYNTLVSEAKFPMRDIVYTDDLRTIIGLKETDKEIRKHFQHNYTIIDIMLSTIQKSCKQNVDIFTQTFQIDNSINVEQMFNRKYDALKEQLSKIYEKQFLEKRQSQSFIESSEIKQLKQKIQIEFQEEYQNRYKAKSKILEAKQQSMKRKQTEFIRVFNQKIQSMVTESSRIKQQSKQLRQQLKKALFKIQSHNCFEQQNYKNQVQALNKEKYKVKQLENKYKLAISNLNTKVQDIIAQKQSILAPNEKFFIDKQRRIKLDDITTKKLLSSITRLEQRVNILAGDNMNYIKESQIKNKRIRYLQGQLRRVQDLLVQQQDALNLTIELKNRYQVQKKTIGTNVNQQQILSQTIDVSEQELKQQQQQIFKMIQQSNKQRLEYLNNIDRINIQMQYIKQKVKDLGEDDI